jgi:hypothetical protein
MADVLDAVVDEPHPAPHQLARAREAGVGRALPHGLVRQIRDDLFLMLPAYLPQELPDSGGRQLRGGITVRVEVDAASAACEVRDVRRSEQMRVAEGGYRWLFLMGRSCPSTAPWFAIARVSGWKV